MTLAQAPAKNKLNYPSSDTITSSVQDKRKRGTFVPVPLHNIFNNFQYKRFDENIQVRVMQFVGDCVLINSAQL